MARLEFAEGALARLRVPVRVSGDPGRSVLTDLDVVALDLDTRLRLTRSILECKSSKGQAGEADRLLWLAGLRRFVEADRAVLVRQTITGRGRVVAAALKLQILDIVTLMTREAAHAWLPDRFAHIDGAACGQAEARTDTQLKGLGHLSAELVAFLRHDALLAQAYRCLSAVDTLRREVDGGGVLPKPTGVVLAGHSLMALLLAGLQDAAALDTMPLDQLRRRIELASTVGSPDDDHVLSVLGRANELMQLIVNRVHRAYVDAGAQAQTVPGANLRALVADPPMWIDRYLDLVQRLRANPSVARDLPQTAELGCFDAVVGDTTYTAPAFDHLFTPEHRYLLLVALACLRDIAGAQLADLLEPLLGLDFDRSPPALPDRTARPDGSTFDAGMPPVALEPRQERKP